MRSSGGEKIWLAQQGIGCAILLALVGSWPVSATRMQERATATSTEALWNQASVAQQAKEYERAASLYRQILAIQPNLTEAEVNLGLMLQLEGNLSDAIDSFQRVLLHHPDLFVPNFLAGMDYLKLDNPGRALPYLERATKEKPDQVEARVGLANSYLQLEKFSQALDQFTRATELDGKFADAWYGLGATYLSIEKQIEGDLRQASSPFRTVLLGESYLQQGQTQKAIATLGTAVAAQPRVPCAQSILGFALLRSSRFDDAARQFQADWNSHTQEGCLLAALGMTALYARKGETEDALRELRHAADVDSMFVQANGDWYWGDIVKAGLSAQAHDILNGEHARGASSIRPSSAVELMRKGHYSDCSAALLKLSAPANMENLRLDSLCSFYIGRDDWVLIATQKLLEHSPRDPEALYWRLQSMERTGLAALTRGTELNPESASIHALMGDMLRAKDDLSEATSEYRKAIVVKPDFIAAHLGLARVLYSDHKDDDAEHEVQYVLKASPNDPEANYLMGEILVNHMALSQSFPFLQRALNVSPEELPYVHADLSTVYEDRGDLEQAIAEMKLAVPVDVDGSYHYRLGHLYMKSGDRAAAANALNQAAKLRRTSDAASLFQK
ncbi:MAG TPA: tetratricopeptide repeat protein [Terracidiphilus sp.]